MPVSTKILLFLVSLISAFFLIQLPNNNVVYATHADWDCFSGCTGNCGGCGSNAGEYVERIWDEGAGECVDIGSDCRTQCSGPCRTCTPWTECKTEPGTNYCCNSGGSTTPNPKPNNVCNDIRHYLYDNDCNCNYSYSDTSPAHHGCEWNNYACCIPPPPPSCNYNRDFNECNSNCNGTNYPDDHLVHVTEYTNPGGSVCRYDCNDLGRIPGQCGVPGDTQLYSCSGTSCVPDDNGDSTDPNCGGSCTAPPPGQRYACSGGACVINASGPYTVAGCGGACTAPPGGCSVGWTLSNENPQPNSNIQVKVRGLSDPQGWSNIGLYLDNSPAGSWGGIENPWPTFVYNNVPARSGGGHTLEFRTNNGSRTCAPSKTFTTVSTTPTNLAVSGQPSCALASYSVTFSWQNTNSTLWLDVSENPGFNGFANKNVSNLTSTNSSGFTLRPGRTYYWRLWNGSTHTSGPSFTVPACNLTVTKPACSTGSYTATLNWQGTNSTLWADLTDTSFPQGFSNKNVSNQTSTAAPSGFNPPVTLTPNTNYLWRLWDGSEHIAGPNFSVPLCNTTVTGRIWKDRDGNQSWQGAAEELIKSDLPSCPQSALPNFFMPGKGVTYTGPVNSTNFPDQCNGPDGPYYGTAPLPPGTYNFTVQANAGWRTYSRTVNLPADDTDNDRVVDLWFGPNPPPENFSLNPLSCSDAAYSRTLSWQNTTQGANSLTLQLSDDGFATFSGRDVSTLTSTVLPNLQPSTFYSTRIDNGTGVYAIGPTWRIPPCAQAWIQVIGGDIHSNAKIKVPPGP